MEETTTRPSPSSEAKQRGWGGSQSLGGGAAQSRPVREAAVGIPAVEQHYTPKQIAMLWGVSEETVRRTFRDLPGVFVLGSERHGKRKNHTIRVPESILSNYHRQHSRGFVGLKAQPRRSRVQE